MRDVMAIMAAWGKGHPSLPDRGESSEREGGGLEEHRIKGEGGGAGGGSSER